MLYDEMPSLSPIVDMKVLDATGTLHRSAVDGWDDEMGDFLLLFFLAQTFSRDPVFFLHKKLV